MAVIAKPRTDWHFRLVNFKRAQVVKIRCAGTPLNVVGVGLDFYLAAGGDELHAALVGEVRDELSGFR